MHKTGKQGQIIYKHGDENASDVFSASLWALFIHLIQAEQFSINLSRVNTSVQGFKLNLKKAVGLIKETDCINKIRGFNFSLGMKVAYFLEEKPKSYIGHQCSFKAPQYQKLHFE